jgi:hypothetical protein
MAPDATRAAIVVRLAGRSRLLLARVDQVGGSIRLTGARRIEATLNDVLDVAWAGSSRLAVLTSGPSGARLYSLNAGLAQGDPIDVPAGSVRVAAGAGRAVLIGQADAEGARVLVRSGGRWLIVAEVAQPVYP